jgi:PAS domain S-box-containing protein
MRFKQPSRQGVPGLNEASLESSINLDGVEAQSNEIQRHPAEVKITVESLSDESLPSSIYFHLDTSGVVLAVNALGVASLGYSPEALIEKPFFNWFHREDQKRLQAEFITFRQNPSQGIQGNFRLLSQDGSSFLVKITAQALQGMEGKTLFLCICDRLQEPQLSQKQPLDLSPVGIFQTDSEGYCLFVNQRWSEITGISATEAQGEGWIRTLHPSDRDQVFTEWNRAVQEGLSFQLEYSLLPAPGKITWVLGQAIAQRDASGAVTGYIGTITDITALKQVEIDLRRSQQQYQSLVNTIDGIVWEINLPDWQFSFVSQKAERLLGYSVQDWLTNFSFWQEHIHPEDQEWVFNTCLQATQSKHAQEFEYRMIAANGETLWLRNLITVVVEDEQAVKLRGVMLDITNRKQMQLALQHQAEQQKISSVIAQRIRQSLNLEETLKTTVAEVRECLHTDRVIIYRCSPNGSGLIIVESVGSDWQPISGTRIHDYTFAETYSQLYQQGRVQAIADIYTAGLTPCHVELLAGFQVRANLVVPIVYEQKLWGLLVAQQCSEPRQWQPFEIDLLTQLATQAAIAIHQSQLYEQAQAEVVRRRWAERVLRQQAEWEQLMGAITQRIRQSLNLVEILKTTVAEVRRFLQVDRVLIYRLFPDGAGSILAEAVGNNLPTLKGKVFSSEVFPAESQKWYSQGNTLAISDIEQAKMSPCLVELMRQFGVKAKFVVPIVQENTLWGLLIAHHCVEPRQWQFLEIDFLKQLASQLGIALHHSELYQQVQKLNTNLEAEVRSRTLELQQMLDFEALLKRITDKVRDSLDESQILQTAVQELTIGLDVCRCDTVLYSLEQGNSTIFYEYPAIDSSSHSQVLQTIDSFGIESQLLQSQYTQFCMTMENLSQPRLNQFAILACPIFDDQGILGELWLFAPQDHVFNDLEVRLVQQVTNQCAIAIRQARLYQAAQTQVKELERLNLLKDDFLNTVSHELRTPMSNIKMATQMLEITLGQEGVLYTENSKTDRYFQILNEECQRELNLINDLLDLSRLDAGTEPLILTTINPQIWIHSIIEPFIERAQSQQQSLQIDIPEQLPLLTTDISYLERILTELLNNACKYTPPGEKITVTAHATSKMLQLSVSNSGVEIPQSELSRMFDKFYRIPNSDPWKHGGTGLGLALVKKLVEHLEATIQVESSQQEITFTVQFPLLAAIQGESIYPSKIN